MQSLCASAQRRLTLIRISGINSVIFYGESTSNTALSPRCFAASHGARIHLSPPAYRRVTDSRCTPCMQLPQPERSNVGLPRETMFVVNHSSRGGIHDAKLSCDDCPLEPA